MVKKIFLIIVSIYSIIKINYFIKKNKKIIFFYHPSPNLGNITSYYIELVFEKLKKKYQVLYGYQNSSLKKNKKYNYFYIKENLLKYISLKNFFVSTYICNNFPKNCFKIYIHHDIYDTPIVSKNLINNLKNRLEKYDTVLIPTDDSKKKFLKIISKKTKIKFHNIGYIKLDILNELKQKLKYKKKKNIIIAPTNIYSFRNFTIFENLDFIIKKILQKTNYNIILRPHPSNFNDIRFQKLANNFNTNSRFFYDRSDNYLKIYLESYLMITDLSGTAYTYAFLTNNPVIFFIENSNLIKKYNYDKLSYFKDIKKIGNLSNKKNFNKVLKNTEKNHLFFKNKIIKLKNQKIPELGKSIKKFDQILSSI